MKTAIVQFDNRPAEVLGAQVDLVRRNGAYARAQGYDHLVFSEAYFDLPAYWQKPSLCRKVMTEAGYDLVLWLDTDAVIHDADRRIETLFEGDEAMVAAPDNPFWSSPFNAGVFAVRGAEGAAILARWADLFAGTAWTRTPTAWVCEADWAGPDFEQGAFARRLLPELAAAGRLRLTDWRTLQAPYPIAGAFALHFAGPFKANLAAYLAA